MPISGPGTKIPGVKDAEIPVPTAFKKVRAGDRVVLLLKGSHGGRYTGMCESQAYSFGYQTGRRTGLVLWGKLSLSGKGLGQGFLNVAEMMVLVVFLDSIVF